MIALSVRQPHANRLIKGRRFPNGVVKFKKFETRTWEAPAGLPVDVLICSGQEPDLAAAREECDMLGLCPGEFAEQYPLGVAIGVVTFTSCRKMQPADAADAMTRFNPALFAWAAENPREVQPFKVRGKLGLFRVDDALIIEVLAPDIFGEREGA